MEAYSNIPALFDRHFYEQRREKFARVHRHECEEVLDNLGYVAVDRNNVYTGATDQDLSEGIGRFREEYATFRRAFPLSGERYGEDRELFSPDRFSDRSWVVTPVPKTRNGATGRFTRQDKAGCRAFFYGSGSGNSLRSSASGTEDPEFCREGSGLLSEEELGFLHRLSSLEGEFDLHHFSLQQIGSDHLLSRVLSYRLSIPGISVASASSLPDPHWPLYLEKLGGWCGVTSQNAVIELLGNAEKLSETLALQDAYAGSRYHHFVYFQSPVQRLSKRMQQQTGDQERFRSRFPFIPTESIVRFEQTISDRNRIEEAVTDELNRLMTRLVQVRLQLLGTYPGRLDSDLGPLSLEGITSLMDYFRENFGASKGFVLSDLLMHLGGDYWALNATYLFKALLPVLEKTGEKEAGESQVQTLSEGIGNWLNSKSIRQNAKESILFTLDEELQKGYLSVSSPSRKPNTRAGKGLLRSIGRFFRHITELIGKGMKRVIRTLKKLFRWFKNAAQVIWRELKEIFSVMSRAINFFFFRRQITTAQGGQSLTTDFDGGFDSITVLSSGSESLIEAHIRSTEAYRKALTQASAFAGTVISVALKVMTGPCGWILLGMEVIRHLAGQGYPG
jgi:hypothetical protein